MKLHPETIACTNFEVAKVFAKVDVSKALPQAINFSKNGKEFVVDFHFPWLPSRCKHCDKWGHTEEVCAVKRKEDLGKVTKGGEEITQQQEINKALETVRSMETTNQQTEKNGEGMQDVQSGNTGVDRAEVESVKEVTQQLEPVEQSIKEAVNTVTEEANNWSNVSPVRAGRSPVVTPQKAVDTHITASKYDVLSMYTDDEEDEEGEIKATESKAGKEVGTEDGVVQTDTTVVAQQIKEGKSKGGKAKKARSQDVNPMAMSTRSSCCHH